jgi:hypothetical protein
MLQHGRPISYKKISVASVRKRTTPTERPPLVNEGSATLLRIEGATWSAWRIPRPYSRISRPELLLFFPSSSSVVLTRLSGPRSRPTTFFFLVVPGTYFVKLNKLLRERLHSIRIYHKLITKVSMLQRISWQCTSNGFSRNSKPCIESEGSLQCSQHFATGPFLSRTSRNLIANNSVASVRERTIPTEGQQLVGEVGANFYG